MNMRPLVAPLRFGIMSTAKIAHAFCKGNVGNPRVQITSVASRSLDTAQAFAKTRLAAGDIARLQSTLIKQYQNTLKTANSEPTLSFTEIERRHLPTDHTIIGRLMTQNWWLPDALSEAIRYHHDLSYLTGSDTVQNRTSQQLIAVSQLAEHLLQQTTGASQTCEWQKLGAACSDILDLSPRDLATLNAEARAQIEQMV